MTSALQLENVFVEGGRRTLLEGVDLRIEAGTILALTGPSGSGKTTLLRTIAGLSAPTGGHVLMFGQTMSASGRILVPPEERRIAMVFQDLGLWPHMNVADHLHFVLAAKGVRMRERTAPIQRTLHAVGLEGRERQRPATLSGGERQRLAIARAIVTEPSIILLDEPLSNLDVVLKFELIDLLAKLLKAQQTTTVLVTHDPREALPLTADFAVLEQGRIVQQGTLAELMHSPRTPFVRRLVAHTAGGAASAE